jgi:hypothetical protein
VRDRVLWGARAVLLAGPIALSFFTGGYFDEARAWAGLIAWVLVVVAGLAAPRLLPRSTAGRMTLVGLGLLAGWTLLSTLWASIASDAYHRGQIAVLYVGGLIAAYALLSERRHIRSGEVAVAAGAVIVVGYGLSERFLPGLLQFSRSSSAFGRLEQPLTYWNAMGELAAIGLILSLRICGDRTRGRGLRMIATAAAVPLGMGLYLSFSRGALFSAFAGLITLALIAPSREQWRSGALALAGAVLAAVAAAPFQGVTSLTGSLSARERDGAIVLGLTLLIVLVALGAQWKLLRVPVPGVWRLPRRAPVIVAGVIAAGLAVAIVAGAKENSKHLSVGANRLETLQSNRYAYWSVAWRAFRDEPIRGVGAGGWAVYWTRYRKIDEFASDAHSLPLQTMAELGLVGLLMLGVLVGGGVATGAQALERAPALAAGPVSATVVYAVHAPLDWDWQMPALTLFALLLLGSLISLADHPAQGESGDKATPKADLGLPGGASRSGSDGDRRVVSRKG